MNDRLYRSVDDRVISGVCGGLAVRMGIDPSLVRIGYAILALLTGIFPLLILYVIMAAVVPEEPTGFAGVGRSPTPPGPGAMPGWTPPSGSGGPAAAVADPGAASTAAWASGGDAGPGAAGSPAAGDAAGAVDATGAAAATGTVVATGAAAATGAVPGDPAAAPTPAGTGWATEPTWSRRELREQRLERRRNDPLPALIGGLVLVGLGVYFLVRDQLTIDWGVVAAAALMALGAVVIIAAFVRPRR